MDPMQSVGMAPQILLLATTARCCGLKRIIAIVADQQSLPHGCIFPHVSPTMVGIIIQVISHVIGGISLMSQLIGQLGLPGGLSNLLGLGRLNCNLR